MVDMYTPNKSFSSKAHVKSLAEYHSEYERSVVDSESFWAEKAETFYWFRKWDRVRSYNYDLRNGPVFIRWFEGG